MYLSPQNNNYFGISEDIKFIDSFLMIFHKNRNYRIPLIFKRISFILIVCLPSWQYRIN